VTKNPGSAYLTDGKEGGKRGLKLVRVIRDPEAAKLISDPMRRAILNLLRQKALTEAELADSLGLTDGTVNYHLRLLRNIGFVTVARTEPEEHGIIQKFYAPSAYLYLPEVGVLPKEVARYYYPINIERIRGVMSAGGEGAARLRAAAGGIDELGEKLAIELVRVARGYAETEVKQGEGEDLVNRIYTEALSRLRSEESSEVNA
jgi:DNA-binding transcriptional ArsR family regulator